MLVILALQVDRVWTAGDLGRRDCRAYRTPEGTVPADSLADPECGPRPEFALAHQRNCDQQPSTRLGNLGADRTRNPTRVSKFGRIGDAVPAAPGWYDDGSGRRRWWDGQQWTRAFQPPFSAPAPVPTHYAWALSPAYSFGLIAFIPALHAAIKLQRRNLWIWAGGLILGDVVGWLLVLSGPDHATDPQAPTTAGQALGTLLIIAMGAAGTAHALRMRGEVFAPSVAPDPAPTLDPAIVNSLAARKRRAESAALCEKDPALGRDLRIGRPDQSRQYDDGGLVDVNHVPEGVLVTHLGLTKEQAHRVVEARDYVEGFSSPADLLGLAGLPPRQYDEIRDRLVVL